MTRHAATAERSGVWYEFHTTPQLWAAYRDDYDGAEDSKNRHMIGFGKTKYDALSDLIEKETV